MTQTPTRGRLLALAALGPLLLVIPAAAQEVGQQVLARWDVRGDRRYAQATVEAVHTRWVDLRYASGEVQRLQTAALALRPLAKGDLVLDEAGAARVVALLAEERVRLALLADGQQLTRPLGEAFALVRTDPGVGARWPDARVAPGDRVLAKWDRYAWYLGQAVALQGEAFLVRYDDGSERWTPADLVLPADRLPEQVFALNAKDSQGILARVLERRPRRFTLRYFDGTQSEVPSARVGAYLDQPGLGDHDPCPGWDTEDPRPHAAVLRGWLSERLRFYADEPEHGEARPDQVEIALAVFSPRGRKAPPGWREACLVLAAQVQAFLTRELGAWATFEVRVLDAPVRGEATAAWYAEHLDEDAAWFAWAPTAACAQAAFPDGARAGRHRVVVVLPDLPGQSDDDSGVERGLGFVRLVGDYVGQLTAARLQAAPPERPAAADWRPDFLATTISHEVLHTLGLPHTDGDPWAVMNLGPWYPVTDPRQHVARLHKLVLRSPFRALALSQGYAAWLLDRDAGYLRVVEATARLDPRFAILYGEGPGLFRLRPLLTAFAPDSACRDGRREDAGERVICRSYLAALVAFLLDRHGPEALRGLFAARDDELAQALPALLDTTLAQLELDWHAWLADHLPE